MNIILNSKFKPPLSEFLLTLLWLLNLTSIFRLNHIRELINLYIYTKSFYSDDWTVCAAKELTKKPIINHDENMMKH